MADDLQDMIEQLKLERGILRDGGYGRSVRTPTKAERLFRDSVTCLNVGQEVQRHPCTDCLLWEFVPDEHQEEDIPCHHIPLNSDHETIAALEDRGDREAAEKALLVWLDSTILRLEKELAERIPPPSR
ncbi:MAG: hypothetical protein DMG21_07175 [Acidobacteria bacterium]|nr:MAG: hypothetical protein DMG21_07175 [Acidobacteriota bacterium]